ncbi:BREX-1 system adenine-specific DNA-methyltransferase PglX [Flagellatimonas centrodinii]|uniref:BREX-1 system adenine-specific DNA-methyltransferase PglX n=1 Tax=Flagellatimonas centrodinii TaxID=2806210 RepID=UPI001FEEA5B5|nr:BREX-1 system adenine-specific DNA-methyltransferase PglX [Flagellatimonas centrodinii]ULQ46296.1 BREX-1 system adenine-specific DNA-methyltransferase PglX [Flagellatimonas centrodinii]
MNKSALKKYAPQARRDFIAAVTQRAQRLGLDPARPATVQQTGDVLLIDGQAYSSNWSGLRSQLQARIKDQGFAQVMDAMAYTWFNRLVAIRYMELHGFLDHGYRVLSHPANKDTGHTQPEILDHINELDLPGLDRSRALDLKLAGNRDEELYREVLLAQCHALHKAMPFLFESLDDATELLLPDGLLRTDSILGKLVTAIDEADWQDVEIIGWLYQFYISEKKDQVIGKVVKSEDIPAATQLFTPNWIVKYLVQNSLGRLWLMANSTSQLATKWEYYIQPAEQTPEVNAQLDTLIQARIKEDGATLNPESLTLLDPACGSGHILVEAYDLLRDIYLERGYRRQDIPRLILEMNLFGLDIDDRAAQLAGFALLMKARADDRRLFGQPVVLNVLALQEAKEGSAAELHSALNAPQIDYATVSQLFETFEQAKTFGSLIQISDELASALPDLQRELEAVRGGGDMLGQDAAETLLRLVEQAEVLAKQFDAVVANPPYMGGKGMNADLKAWAKKTFPASKADLFAMFIERGFGWCKPAGFNGMVTMQSWMFLSSFEDMRTKLLENRSISTMAHLGARAFSEISGEVVQTTAFVLQQRHITGFCPVFFRLVDGSEPAKAEALRTNQNRFDTTFQDEFIKVPGSPIAYWLTQDGISTFVDQPKLADVGKTRRGLQTGQKDKFIRYWHECDSRQIEFRYLSRNEAIESPAKWFMFNNGGDFRKWFGNLDLVVNWKNNGSELKEFPGSIIPSEELYFEQAVAWPRITTTTLGFRLHPEGVLPGDLSPCYYTDDHLVALGYLNSSSAGYFLNAINPTITSPVGDIAKIPIPRLSDSERTSIVDAVSQLIEIHKADWNNREQSWDFCSIEGVKPGGRGALCGWAAKLKDQENRAREKTLALESELQRTMARLCLVESVVSTAADPLEICIEQQNDSSRAAALTSYAIGCMMGRYSLDAPGLIYAHAGNEGFDPSRYETFPADDDGIVPITDEAWFDDDGANRIREFVRVVWGEDTEAENMAWLAESLGSKASESVDDTIRRYLSRDFYKDHLQTYKKRPIYWLFSSGKHKAFEALVYLHRYNAGTLSRMRMEYVVPLQSRMQARIDKLEDDITSTTSSAQQKALRKQKDKLAKQLEELRSFDEKLRHFADQRITLDLDDGVKVNYGKFGDLLAEVKAVTGGSSDES